MAPKKKKRIKKSKSAEPEFASLDYHVEGTSELSSLDYEIEEPKTKPKENVPEEPVPGPSKYTEFLSDEGRKILDHHRKDRAMMEAEEIGNAVFMKLPDNLQKRILDLIRIMDSIGRGHPKLRTRMVKAIVDGFLDGARAYRLLPVSLKNTTKEDD